MDTAPHTEYRKFAILMGTLILSGGMWFWWKGYPASLWMVAGGAAFALIGIMFPKSMARVYHYWMAFSSVLGRIQTTLILAIIYFTILTPVALALKLSGRDPMERGFSPNARTYWKERKPLQKADEFGQSF